MMPTTDRIISDSRKSAKKAKSGDVLAERAKAYVPNIPEPKCRADLIKHWIDLSLDDKTANKMLWITEGGSKVARMTDDQTCPVLDRAERYEHSPQVLCKEGILGFRAYWEVDYSGWVIVGVAFEGAGRRNSEGSCGLGENEESWALGWCGSSYSFWHNGQSEEIKDLPRCPTIGMYLDQPAGLLQFYGVLEAAEGAEASARKEVTLLQTIRTPFPKKIIPGFWMGPHSHCLILKMEE